MFRVFSAALVALSLPLAGCVVGAAATVATTAVKTGVGVAGAVAGAGVKATGAVVRTATGH
jgi:hypothetical protein